MKREATSRAFCSTANLGAGFDVFGLALKQYSDKIKIRVTNGRKIRIFVKGELGKTVPRDAKRNAAGPPATALLRRANFRKGLEILIEKGVPQGLGLGSSGASAAACTKGLDLLLELELPDDELVRTASLGEKAVTGNPHADNVAASLLGGFVIVYDNPVRTVSLTPPRELSIVVVTPELPMRENKTRLARRLLPEKLTIQKAVLNVGRASAIASGFATGDIARIGSGMNDEIAEPYREKMIPGYRQVKEAALSEKAAGVSISGAGPSIIAIVDRNKHEPARVGKAMIAGFRRNNIKSRFFVTEPAPAASIIRS